MRLANPRLLHEPSLGHGKISKCRSLFLVPLQPVSSCGQSAVCSPSPGRSWRDGLKEVRGRGRRSIVRGRLGGSTGCGMQIICAGLPMKRRSRAKSVPMAVLRGVLESLGKWGNIGEGELEVCMKTCHSSRCFFFSYREEGPEYKLWERRFVSQSSLNL